MGFPGTAKITVTANKTVKVVIGRFRGQYSRSGIVDIGEGVDEVVVTFGTTLPDANYTIHPSFFNSGDNADLSPFLLPKITAKGANGFTIKLSAPTTSANFKLHWSIAEVFNP